jgi:hypothetical protein
MHDEKEESRIRDVKLKSEYKKEHSHNIISSSSKLVASFHSLNCCSDDKCLICRCYMRNKVTNYLICTVSEYILGYRLLFDLDWNGGPNWYGSRCFTLK